jgi:glyoxylase-like metal-dependent hydrolase (beta-lactamase superfamily II)
MEIPKTYAPIRINEANMIFNLTRSAFVLVLLAATAWAVIPLAVVSAQDMSDVQIQDTKVADNIYMLAGQGGNMGLLVGSDGIFLIDDEFAPLHDKIMAKIRELAGEDPESAEHLFLLNTHFHGDHTGGNVAMGQAGMTILAHRNVRDRLTTEQFVKYFNMRQEPLAPAGLPVLTFTNDIALHLNGQDIDIFHVAPAHTDGDAVVHFKDANVIVSGDILFIGTYPFIDVPNGGHVEGMIKGTERILALCNDQTKIVPGHGPLTDKAGVEKYHQMLSTIYQKVKAMIDNGQTLEQARAAKPTAEFDADWGTRIKGDDLIGFIYEDLSGKK